MRLDAERDALYGKLRRLLAQADAFTEQRDIYEKERSRTEDTLKLTIADYRGKRTDFCSLIETYRELLMFETQLARINASLAGTVAQISAPSVAHDNRLLSPPVSRARCEALSVLDSVASLRCLRECRASRRSHGRKDSVPLSGTGSLEVRHRFADSAISSI